MITVKVVSDVGNGYSKIVQSNNQYFFYFDKGMLVNRFIFQPINDAQRESLLSDDYERIKDVDWTLDEIFGDRNFITGKVLLVYQDGSEEEIDSN